MIYQVFSVYDVKSKAFARPFYEARTELAVRQCAAVVMDQSQMLAKFPQDYTLYRLGSFNDELGSFELLPQPEIVCMLNQLKGE